MRDNRLPAAPQAMRTRDPLTLDRLEPYGSPRRPAALTRRPRPIPAARYNRPAPADFRGRGYDIVESPKNPFDVAPEAWAPAVSLAVAPVDPADEAPVAAADEPTVVPELVALSAEPVASPGPVAFSVEPEVEPLPTLSDSPKPARTGGLHRLPAPPAALRGRAAMLAVAAGAVVAAGQATVSSQSTQQLPLTTDTSELALAGSTEAATTQPASFVTGSGSVAASAPAAAEVTATPQLIGAATNGLGNFNDLLEKGQKFTEEREAAAQEALRPLFALPASGSYTSGFGTRWGTLHGGIDIANAIGTPILAVADGTVIDSGPASGFGMWVRLLHADGTVTVYGHIDQTLVQVGQKVMAGDQIATMGNRGFSTGPHLHFEVHLNGDQKIDPVGWLATRGISLGGMTD